MVIPPWLLVRVNADDVQGAPIRPQTLRCHLQLQTGPNRKTLVLRHTVQLTALCLTFSTFSHPLLVML